MKYVAKNLRQIIYKQEKIRRIKTFIFSFITFILISNFIITFILNSSNIKITAHRGNSGVFPENTTTSILASIALDVDYIEIDVQLTKDEKIILLHDSTFKRTAGVRIHPWEMTYEEILALNVGNYLQSTFIVPAPSLEEILKLCPPFTILNIELKDYGHSEKLPGKVVSLIEDYDFINNCVISSKSLKLLKEVNRLNPDIKTGLITSSVSISTYSGNNFLDFYSVNYIALNPSLSLYIHSRNKEIYCWTPNAKAKIEYAIYCGADNIITNNVSLAKYLIIAKGKN